MSPSRSVVEPRFDLPSSRNMSLNSTVRPLQTETPYPHRKARFNNLESIHPPFVPFPVPRLSSTPFRIAATQDINFTSKHKYPSPNSAFPFRSLFFLIVPVPIPVLVFSAICREY